VTVHTISLLALRLASLESWLQSHEPIPFIVDDILLNFDDGRAIAAWPLSPNSHGEPRSCSSRIMPHRRLARATFR